MKSLKSTLYKTLKDPSICYSHIEQILFRTLTKF